MEDDDEFGDLYSDVLQPLAMSSAPPQPPCRSIDPNNTIPSDDEEILYGATSSNQLNLVQNDSNRNMNTNENSAKVEDCSGEQVSPAADLRASSSGLVKLEDKGFEEDPNYMNDDTNFGIEDTGGDQELKIPGLWSSEARVSEQRDEVGEGDDNWDDSDSEDDLQILLNDNNNNNGGGMMGMEGGGGADDADDEDEDNLVILGDNDDPNHDHDHQVMEEMQDWGDDASEGGGGRKDLLVGDAAKVNGGVGPVIAPKIGYSSHGYHPFHSQFKYVRPGVPGAAPIASGGAPGQIRPPASVLPFSGRGRGDWRPPGLRNNGAVRGLEFTLPSHKTIFEVDIDGFEEKPWRLQGIDISDFFNFGLNEDSWKEFCKQLDQFRLEATMQSKIRVYESGRTEQQFDPDLPPELAAAAAGVHDISSENQNIGKANVAKGLIRSRMQLPSGRAIQVETGSGERLPSIDTRPPRPRDSDAIIEIILQGSADDESVPGNDIADQPPDAHNGSFQEKEFADNEKEGSPENVEGKQSPCTSRLTYGSAEEHDFSHNDDAIQDDVVIADGSTVNEKEIALDITTSKDENRSRPMKNQTLVSKAARSSVDNREDSKAARSSDNNSKERSGSSRDQRNMHDNVEEEVVQVGNTRRSFESDRHRKTMERMEDPYSHKKWDSNSQSENFYRQKGRESEGAWQDADLHRAENMRKRERVEEMASRQRHNKIRESERSDKDQHYSRKVSENGSWKGDRERDFVSQHNNDSIKSHHESVGIHNKRRKEEAHSTSRQKRKKDDNLDQRKRDELARLWEDEKQRERNEWKEREMRSGHSRLKEDYRSTDREYRVREKPGRRDRIENESLLRHTEREDAYSYGKKLNDDEKISRQERGNTGGGHNFSAVDIHKVQDKRHKESIRKSKETDGVAHSSLAPSRRNQEDHSSQKSERVSSTGVLEQGNSEQTRLNRQSSRKHKANASQEDERKDSRRGRSKLERWSSHKDVDFSLSVVSSSASLSNVEKTSRYNDTDPMKPVNESSKSNSNSLVEENDDVKTGEEGKHLDTVEKLKKRSERFKLPMPSEKEALAIKKVENEVVTHPDSAIKPERPARKRRWTSG